MNSDPIQHLRELMAKACPMYAKASTYHNDGKLAAHVFHANVTGHELLKITGEPGNVRLLVDLIPHIPALLAVADAAREMRKVQRQCAYDASICAAGRTYTDATRISFEQECDVALAALEKQS